MQPIITENREAIAELCRAHHVRRLAVFGSAARDDFDPATSDIDLLVEFETLPYPDSVQNKWSLEEQLQRLFARKIDLIRYGNIENPFLLREIQRDEEMLFAA